MENEIKNWKEIKKIEVGSHKKGYLMKGEDGELKLIIVAEEDTEDFKRRIENFIGQIHPNVAHVDELTTDEDGKPLVIMEYVFGYPITRVLKTTPLITYIAHFKQVFDAIDFLRSLGLLHLCISPKYTITDAINGITKIIDCWHVHISEDVEQGNILANFYSAPEVTHTSLAISRSEVDQAMLPDERSDLYSVAAMMYEAWTGQPLPDPDRELHNMMKSPSLHASRVAPNSKVANRHYEEELRTMIKEGIPTTDMRCNHRGEAPKELGENLVLKLLNRDPDKRGFTSAREVVNYIMNTWPDVRKPAKELYGKIMTTMRL